MEYESLLTPRKSNFYVISFFPHPLTLQEMFDASLKDRELSFKSAPGTTMFLHWLVGMVYVFYFASFILLLREVRAGPSSPFSRSVLGSFVVFLSDQTPFRIFCPPPSGAEARSAVVSEKPQRPRFQPGAGDDSPAHLPAPASLHPVRGGVRLHRAAHAVAAHPAHQAAAAHLPAVQCHALQVN